ncbi:hypothetical protein [Hephaestia caeni]|uniref:hypothetical protein n=1 Tax=Hephaestia caeni TaxID=645617 RepID=UPI0011C49315|nr:hypothetical protein [Hephaestia caeni]
MTLLVTGHANVAAAQTAAAPRSAEPQITVGDSEGQEIVVEGERVPVIKTPTKIVLAGGAAMIDNRIALDKAQIFVHCLGDIDPGVLREILDGPPNKASTQYAQGLLVSKHIGCHLGYSPLSFDDVKSRGDSMFDRGALLEYALERYAPDLLLTAADTHDPAVRRRFNEREAPRNRWRLPVDYRHFEIALCMVREAPELSVRLVKSPVNSELHRRLQAAIIGIGRICLGSPKKVVVDATAFRIWIGDAVWRWAEAARDVDSLIPLPD